MTKTATQPTTAQSLGGFQPANPKGLKARNVIAWAGASPTSAGPGQSPLKISQAL